MIVLGIDPGFATCGFAVVKFIDSVVTPISFGVVSTKPSDSTQNRLLYIHSQISQIINQFQPEVLGIERLFFGKNSTSAINVAQARGIVLLAAAQADLPVVEFFPTQIKLSLTGYGRASKQLLTDTVTNLLKLPAPPKPDDAADAIAIAISTAFSTNCFLSPTASSLTGGDPFD